MHRRTVTSSTAAFTATVATTRTVAAVPAIATVTTVAHVAPRFRFGQQITPLGEIENFALVQPRLDPDHAVRGVRFGETVIDIGAQGVQRKLPLQIPFAARDFRAVQAAAHAHLDALAAEAQRRIHRLAHRAAEGHALFQLQRDRFAHQLRVQLGLVHFLNVDEDLTLGLLRHVLLEFFDLRALASDDDAGTRRADGDPQLVARPVHFDRAHAGALQPLGQRRLQLQVFLQELCIALLSEPARPPRLVEAQPESVRMNFLSHYASFSVTLMTICAKRRWYR